MVHLVGFRKGFAALGKPVDFRQAFAEARFEKGPAEVHPSRPKKHPVILSRKNSVNLCQSVSKKIVNQWKSAESAIMSQKHRFARNLRGKSGGFRGKTGDFGGKRGKDGGNRGKMA